MARRLAPSVRIVQALVGFGLGCSDETADEQRAAVGVTATATPASIIQAATRASGRSSVRGSLAFTTATGERIAVTPDAYEFNGDYLAATGAVPGSEGGSFLLKGDSTEIYGFLMLPDRNLAYEYTTSGQGELIVESVPLTKILPVCDDPPAAEAPSPLLEVSAAAPTGNPPHVGAYPSGTDTSKLQSKPGATKVLYLELSVLSLPPAELWEAWQIVAAAFSAFDINVTTDEDVYEATEMRNSGKACMHDEEGRSECVVNAFGTSRCCDIFNKGDGHYQGLSTSHELGHLMGLNHDGTQGDEYFVGFSTHRWCPIMGQSTPKESWGNQLLFQWSKGEYSSANNTEDDLAIISRKAPYRPDDIPTTKPLAVRSGSVVSSDDNRGQIASNTDTDTFTFEVGPAGGRATLTIDRIENVGGGYLDVDAELRSATGMVLAQSNDSVARTAKFDLNVPAGRYDLVVKGGAEGTPSNGFSNYSSLGFYGISGTLSGAVVGGSGGMAGAAGMGGAAGRSAGGNAGAGGVAVGGRGGVAGSGVTAAGSGGMSGAGTGGMGGRSAGGEAGLGGIGGAPSAGFGGVIIAGAPGGGSAGAAGTTESGAGGATAGTAGAFVSGSGGATAGSAGATPLAGAAGAPGPTQGEFVDDESGCGCRTKKPSRDGNAAWLASLVALGWLRRRSAHRRDD
jgi:MYXO-CTERM domain-containing protein